MKVTFEFNWVTQLVVLGMRLVICTAAALEFEDDETSRRQWFEGFGKIVQHARKFPVPSRTPPNRHAHEPNSPNWFVSC